MIGYLLGTFLYATVTVGTLYNTTALGHLGAAAAGYPTLFALGFGAAGGALAFIYSAEKEEPSK